MQLILVAFCALSVIMYFYGIINMSKKKKLIAKLKSDPKTFTFDDAETLLGYFSYIRSNKGKTSGSRIMFSSEKYSTKNIAS